MKGDLFMKRIVSLVLVVVLLLTYCMSFTAFAEEDEHTHEEVIETHEYVPDGEDAVETEEPADTEVPMEETTPVAVEPATESAEAPVPSEEDLASDPAEEESIENPEETEVPETEIVDDAPEDLAVPEETDTTEDLAEPEDANALTLDPELMAIDTPLEQKTRNSNMQNYWIHATRESSALFTKTGSENCYITYQNGKVMNVGSGISDTHFYYEPVELSHELPIYGGSFVNNEDHSVYLIFGQNNHSESDTAETLRIVKYVPDESGFPGQLTRDSSLSISGLNTYEPFTAGSCRAAASNGYLYVYTCHSTYPAVNGEYQQENLLLVIRLSDFTLVDHVKGTVRHSFNQYVATDGSKVVTVDHGDAYPRAIVLNEYSAGASLGEPTTVNVLNIAGEIGDNRTGVTLGGLIVTPEAYIVTGTAVGTNGGTNYQGQRNVFVARINRSDVSEAGMTITWITNHAEGANVQVSTPQIVRYTNVGAYIVLWTEDNELHYSLYNKTGKYLRGNTPGTVYDTKHNLTPSSQYALEVGMLSDCQPVAQQERLVCWYCIGPDETYFLYYITVGSYDSYPKVHHECSPIVNLIDEPTMTTKGHYTYYCPHCHDGEGTIFELATFDERLVGPRESGQGRTIITMPTCTQPGWASYHIVYSLPDQTKLEYDVEEAVPALGHNFYNGVCTRCGALENDPNPCADGHTWNEGEITTDPTCTAEGVKTFTCTVCGETYTEPVAALGHNYEDTNVIDPTCTEPGYTVRTCTRCGDTYNYNELPATGHTWGDWTITIEPTCTESGEKEHSCVKCSAKESEAIDALGHNYVDTVHAPTCVENGYTEHVCSRCSDSWIDNETPALGHDWEEWTVEFAATCTAPGSEIRYCTRCDASERRTINPLGHDMGEWAQTTPPTCTTAGENTRNCSRCDYTEHLEIPALGHNWDEGTVAIEPTEDAPGLMLYTCQRCGETKTEEIPPLSHVHDYSYNTIVVDPTCTEDGYTRHICSCGAEYTDTPVSALGHEFEITHEVAPTCTQEGFVERTCTRCGVQEIDDKVPALGHEWDEGQTTVEPTYLKEGVLTYTCVRCGETKTVPIPMKDLPFKDIDLSSFYMRALRWSYQNGIIGGTSHTTFSPQNTCNRAMIVTILWRFAGSPAASDDYVLPFTDVKEDKYYYEAVRWAAETGVTAGTSDTTFSPDKPCTRAQIVTFVWRYTGAPMVETENPFEDVKAKQYYYDAVMWAVKNGVTAGTTNTTFTPDRECMRCEAVTFIYRFAKVVGLYPDE